MVLLLARGYLVEQEGAARGAREARGDELRAVGQRGVAVGAAEQARAADVVQEDASHGLSLSSLPLVVVLVVVVVDWRRPSSSGRENGYQQVRVRHEAA